MNKTDRENGLDVTKRNYKERYFLNDIKSIEIGDKMRKGNQRKGKDLKV